MTTDLTTSILLSMRKDSFHWIVVTACFVWWVALSLGAQAQTLGTLSDWTVGLGSIPLDASDAAFYRSHADPFRGEPQTVTGGRWLLETDRRSQLAYPRLFSLTKGGGVTQTNDLLQAVHGRNLRWEVAWRRRIGVFAFGRPDALDEPAVEQTGVKLTYLSDRHLSLVMLGGRLGPANGSDVMAQGVAIDLQRGTLLTINACGRRRVHFTFGNLLTVCDDGKFEIFRDLWREQARLVAATAPYQSKWQDACRTRVLAHFDDGDDDYVWFSLYLTPEGLAVHNVFALGALERGCVSDPDSPFFPVIIPWRKLSSLMNAGPLRDELLADR